MAKPALTPAKTGATATGAGAKAVLSPSKALGGEKPRRRSTYSDESDDDYRPRRPTCSVGIQCAVPVDVGVQCELQPEPRAPDDPFGPWMQAQTSLAGSTA